MGEEGRGGEREGEGGGEGEVEMYIYLHSQHPLYILLLYLLNVIYCNIIYSCTSSFLFRRPLDSELLGMGDEWEGKEKRMKEEEVVDGRGRRKGGSEEDTVGWNGGRGIYAL